MGESAKLSTLQEEVGCGYRHRDASIGEGRLMLVQLNTTGLVDRYGVLDDSTRKNLFAFLSEVFERGSVVNIELSITSTDEPKRGVCVWKSPENSSGYSYPCENLLNADGWCPHLEDHRKRDKEALMKDLEVEV